MNEPEKPKKGWGWLQWGVAVAVMLLMASLYVPTFARISPMANQSTTSNNCRQIIMALKIYAEENNGVIPDGETANLVFRKLIQKEVVQDERIFGGKVSPFVPDDNIGIAPNFEEAVSPGENHWMIVVGLKPGNAATIPFVYENTTNHAWPPIWRIDSQSLPLRGRVWRGGKIIVGRLDNSVNVENLVKKSNGLTFRDKFMQAIEREISIPLRILDIEERK